MTITDAIAAAIAAELERRRAWLDTFENLTGVTVTVKLTKVGDIRSVLCIPQLETKYR